MKISLRCYQAQTVRIGASSHKRLSCTSVGHSKSKGIPKLHHCFKSYGNFDEWLDFAKWWSRRVALEARLLKLLRLEVGPVLCPLQIIFFF